MTTQIQTTDLTWSSRTGFQRATIVVPGSTEVAALNKAGEAILARHSTFKDAERELTLARDQAQRLSDTLRAEVANDGAAGKKLDKARLRRRREDSATRLEDAELERDHAEAALDQARFDYLAVLRTHAPALAHEARQQAESAILSLTTALEIKRKAGAGLTAALGILGTLPDVLVGGYFEPKVPEGRKTTADQFEERINAVVMLGVADEPLTKSIGFAMRTLETLDEAEKERKAAAKAEAERVAAQEAQEAAVAERIAADEERARQAAELAAQDEQRRMEKAERKAERKAAKKAAKAAAKAEVE